MTSNTARYLYHCRPVSLLSHALGSQSNNNQIHHKADNISTQTSRQGTIADHRRRRILLFVRRVIARNILINTWLTGTTPGWTQLGR